MPSQLSHAPTGDATGIGDCPATITCPDCHGAGEDRNHTWGSGDLPCPDYMKDVHPACERCEGQGEIDAPATITTSTRSFEMRPYRPACKVHGCLEVGGWIVGSHGFRKLGDERCIGLFCAEHGMERIAALDPMRTRGVDVISCQRCLNPDCLNCTIRTYEILLGFARSGARFAPRLEHIADRLTVLYMERDLAEVAS